MHTAYLDHAASTPMRPEALTAMLPFLAGNHANPTGSHHLARAARRAIDDARDAIADLLGIDGGGIVFCGSGSEADNLAVFGIGVDDRVVCSAIEHHAVLHAVERRGGAVVNVDRHGIVDLDHLSALIDDRTTLVSIMAVNNEVGTVQPVAAIAEVVRARSPRAVLHTDAVQAHQWMDVRDVMAHVDAMTLSAHKFGGPKGVGLLAVRPGVEVRAQIVGGGQERERRSGTHNVAGIVAAAVAASSCAAHRAVEVEQIAKRRDRLVDALIMSIDGVTETVPRSLRVAGNAHVIIDAVDSESVLFLLDRMGIAASAGSSCSSGATQVSHVLGAMGRTDARGAVRFSLGWNSTDEDVDHVLDVLPAIVSQVRG